MTLLARLSAFAALLAAFSVQADQYVVPGSTNASSISSGTLANPRLPPQLQTLSLAAQTTSTPVNIIYDDDCASDVACGYTLSALHHWIDIGAVKVLAYVADVNNTTAAPVLKIFNTYWNHPVASTLIGTYNGANVTSTGNTSAWAAGTVTQFNPGDTSSNYSDCVTVYRRALAAASNGSVVIVSTGFLSCIAGLMASAADGISALTGPQLIQAKVTALYLMGGDYPTGTEFNLVNDAVDANYVFANWTSQNGYPIINLSGFTPGNAISVGRPLYFPTTDPAIFAGNIVATKKRPGWDILPIYQAVFGTSSFTASANGTNSVNSSTGANTWSSGTASGHIYYTLTNAAAFYNALLDGQTNQGADWWLPQGNPTQPSLAGPGFQCTPQLSGCELAGAGLTLSNSVNAPLIAATTNISAATVGVASFLDPSLTSNQQINIQWGRDASTGDLVSINYTFASAGNQRFGIGFFGTSEFLQVYENGRVFVNGGLVSTGTKFTTSGCTISATSGGAQAGTFTLGSNTCTAVITINGATGITSANGWSCQAHDRTAPTVLIGGESSSTTTTASFTIPAGAGATDVISYSCMGY